MATPYVEYTDPDGNKSKLVFNDELTTIDLDKFYTDYIKDEWQKCKDRE